MNKVWNVMNAPPSIDRASVGGGRGAANDAFIGRSAQPFAARAADTGAAAIERLVLAGSSEEAGRALETRAALIAGDMHPSPRLVKLGRIDDLVAPTRRSDLILVDRKKPARFIVPYVGRAARQLLRKSDAPMLVVSDTAEDSYRRVVLAADLQTDIGPALAAVEAIAPNASLTVLHVYQVPFEGKLQWAGVPATDIEEYRAEAQREAAVRMADLVYRHDVLHPSRTLLKYGWPIPQVIRTSAELEADLIVVVRNSQSWWTDALGGSVSLEVAQRAERDVLIVRAAAPRGRADAGMSGIAANEAVA